MMRPLLMAFVLCGGCVYGGSDEDPLAGLNAGTARADVASLSEDAGEADDSSSESPVSTATNTTPGSAASSSTSALSEAGEPDAQGASDASTAPSTASSGACAPAQEAAVCDPVRNQGCPPIPLMQCDVDPSASEPTGRCAIFTPTPIVPCSSTTTAESVACFAKSTCVDDQCRTLCYCDDDCPSGTTCGSETVGGFRLCG